jgi:hypothetical protein
MILFGSPQSSGWTEKFVTTFKTVCRQLNIPFAKPDPNLEKAYDTTTRGVVLGIFLTHKPKHGV